MNASELVQASGSINNFSSGLRTDNFGEGDAGDLTINTPVFLMEDGAVISSSTFPDSTGNGGKLTVNASELVQLRDESELLSTILGTGNGGDLKIRSPRVIVQDGSRISTTTRRDGNGKAGNLEIHTAQLLLQNRASIDTANFGQGDGGDITLFASESVELSESRIVSQTEGEGNAGNINIKTRSLSVINGASVSTNTLDRGRAGDINIVANKEILLDGFDGQGSASVISSSFGDNPLRKVINIRLDSEGRPIITIQSAPISLVKGVRQSNGNLYISTNSLSVTNGARLNTSTFGQGNAGNIDIVAQYALFSGTDANGFASGAFSGVQPRASGDGGTVKILTNSLTVTEGAQLVASTSGKGNAGQVTIQASDTVSINGNSRNASPSGVFTAVADSGIGNGGRITIETGFLLMTNGAKLSANSRGMGDAGSITIEANDTISLDGVDSQGFPSRVSSVLEAEAVGNGGNLTLIAGQLNLLNNAETTVSSEGTGDAGNLEVTTESIYLDNGRLTAESASGSGGNIQLNVEDVLLLRDNSLISALSGVTGNDGIDGNITIDTTFLIAIPNENSDIVATGFGRSVGSNIQVNAQRIFGTQFRQQRTPDNDIVATGTVVLNTPDIDPTQDLAPLPITFIDMSNQVDNSCSPYGRLASRGNKFIITGRGGIPASPSQPLESEAVWEDWRFVDETEPTESIQSSQRRRNRESSLDDQPRQIVEAQGWYKDAQGHVILTADSTMVTPHGSGWTSANCLSEKL